MALLTPTLRFDKREISTADDGRTYKITCRYYYWDGHQRVYHTETSDDILAENVSAESADMDDLATTWFNSAIAPS